MCCSGSLRLLIKRQGQHGACATYIYTFDPLPSLDFSRWKIRPSRYIGARTARTKFPLSFDAHASYTKPNTSILHRVTGDHFSPNNLFAQTRIDGISEF